MSIIEITTVIGCTVNCRYCPQHLLRDNYSKLSNINKMSLATFKTCLDKIPISTGIYFSGFSEPFLNNHCSDMMLYAYQKGHKIGLYTTLVGMNHFTFERIKDIEYESLVIHIPDVEGNTKIKITTEYLNLLCELTRTVKVAYESGFSCHGNVPKTIHAKFPSLIPYNYASYMVDRAGNLSDPLLTKQFHFGEISCRHSGRLINKNVLLPNGDVALCCMDFGVQHILGNLLDSEYYDLFNNPGAKKIKQAFSNERIPLLCRKCSAAVKNH